MATSLNVALLGATGETGSSIMKGLINSTEPRYNITALARPASVDKPALLAFKEQGVKIVAVDLDGSAIDLAAALKGMDVVISAIDAGHLLSQIPLANACKDAGVGRFVPCCFSTVTAPGVLNLQDLKDDVLDHIKRIHLPYTVIDVGWWYQSTLPRLPSGRTDYIASPSELFILGDGNTPFALTDLGDIGLYTARIVCDKRTLNKSVFAFTEIKTQNEIYATIEELSGETATRNHLSADKLAGMIADVKAQKPAQNTPDFFKLAVLQYWRTWGLRGDNQPEYATYLGYLLADELYPGLKGRPFTEYCKEVLEGKAHKVYENVTFF
ncbi:hypothetical protein SEUCBS139899_003012 [Sporothrix eucalyptigena]